MNFASGELWMQILAWVFLGASNPCCCGIALMASCVAFPKSQPNPSAHQGQEWGSRRKWEQRISHTLLLPIDFILLPHFRASFSIFFSENHICKYHFNLNWRTGEEGSWKKDFICWNNQQLSMWWKKRTANWWHCLLSHKSPFFLTLSCCYIMTRKKKKKK